MKKESFENKLSLRKNKLNNYILSKRKPNNIDIEQEEEIKKYIISIEDLDIQPQYIIKDINKVYSNVILNIIINIFVIIFSLI